MPLGVQGAEATLERIYPVAPGDATQLLLIIRLHLVALCLPALCFPRGSSAHNSTFLGCKTRGLRQMPLGGYSGMRRNSAIPYNSFPTGCIASPGAMLSTRALREDPQLNIQGAEATLEGWYGVFVALRYTIELSSGIKPEVCVRCRLEFSKSASSNFLSISCKKCSAQ